MHVNKLTLIGNLGDDAELRTTQSGTPYTYVRMATNENYKDGQGNWQTSTEWHTLKIWGQSSNRAAQVLKKGMLVYIEGRVRSHTNTENKRFWEVRVDLWRSLEKGVKDKLLAPEPPEPQASWQNNHNPSPFGEGFTRR